MPDDVLKIISSEILPENTDFIQLDDGTIFYYQETATESLRLYVKSDGKEIQATPPGEISLTISSHENAVYFENDKGQIYKAMFTAPDAIDVSYVRNKLRYEAHMSSGTHCTYSRDGKEYVYRVYENPETDGTLIDLSEKDLQGRYLMDAIGNKLFYVSTSTGHDEKHRLRSISDNIIPLELRPRVDVDVRSPCAQDGPFFYVVHGVRLFAANTQTMELLPALRFTDLLPPVTIKAVRDGVITVMGKRGGKSLRITAKLPNGYGTKAEPDDDIDYISEFQTNFAPFKILGQGGFGCVFAAENKLDKWNYAVKRIPVRGKQHEIDKALIEVWALASFDHPCIVRYNNAWTEHPPDGWQRYQDDLLLDTLNSNEQFIYKDDSKFLYIQMELCDFTLVDWLKGNAQRDLSRMKSWFKQIVSAVAYIHERGKIHRDLKPSNILFASEDQLKICDLGIVADRAIKDGQEIAMSRTMDKGTAMYMAPEQSGWSEYSAKVDIFALGLILAQMCVPLFEDAAEEAFENYRRGKPNDILRLLPDVESFVAWLTNPTDTERPECKQILEHTFLAR